VLAHDGQITGLNLRGFGGGEFGVFTA